jgi:hypothetical protein
MPHHLETAVRPKSNLRIWPSRAAKTAFHPVSLALHGTSISTSNGPRGSSALTDVTSVLLLASDISLGGSAAQPLSFRAVAVAPQRTNGPVV